MTKKSIYSKEDLLWEAVRRNQDFIKFYHDELEKKEGEGKTIAKDERLTVILNIRKWHISRLPDPIITADEIKEQIIKNEKDKNKQESLHPYAYLFRGHANAVIHYCVPDSPYSFDKNMPAKYVLSELNNSQVCIDKAGLIVDPLGDNIHRLLVSIDPTASNEVIFSEIKKIKSDAVKTLQAMTKKNLQFKKRLGGLVEIKNGYPVNDEKIDDYIGWLQKYDKVIARCIELHGKESLFVVEGALEVPQEFNFQEVVPKLTESGDDFYSKLKTLKIAYKGALSLIKKAPNLIFNSPSKDSKITQS